MTDEEFHNIVLSQTFEVLSKAIQLAHGNKMITAQRCRESIESKKMSAWEIAAGSRRSQSTRDLCSKNAQLMFSRAVRNALHQKVYNVNATPIVRALVYEKEARPRISYMGSRHPIISAKVAS